jgi:hypothetical protein
MLHRASEWAGPCEHDNEPSGSIYFTSWVTTSFSRRILFHDVSQSVSQLVSYVIFFERGLDR